MMVPNWQSAIMFFKVSSHFWWKPISFHYRGDTTVIGTSSTEMGSNLSLYWSGSKPFIDLLCSTPPWKKKAGRLGNGNSIWLLLSMRTTVAIVGLSVGSSCTHNRPIWMHLTTSFVESITVKFGSNASDGLPSLHSFQTCTYSQGMINPIVHVTLILDLTVMINEGTKFDTHIAHKVFCAFSLIEWTVLLSANNFKK